MKKKYCLGSYLHRYISSALLQCSNAILLPRTQYSRLLSRHSLVSAHGHAIQLPPSSGKPLKRGGRANLEQLSNLTSGSLGSCSRGMHGYSSTRSSSAVTPSAVTPSALHRPSGLALKPSGAVPHLPRPPTGGGGPRDGSQRGLTRCYRRRSAEHDDVTPRCSARARLESSGLTPPPPRRGARGVNDS